VTDAVEKGLVIFGEQSFRALDALAAISVGFGIEMDSHIVHDAGGVYSNEKHFGCYAVSVL
jgi:hypothetical protein